MIIWRRRMHSQNYAVRFGISVRAAIVDFVYLFYFGADFSET